MNNTINHVSDKSKYVTFDPTNSDWPATITNVQDALSTIGSWARKDVGLPGAAVGKAGVLQIATQDEVNAGKDNTKAVTPLTLATRLGNPRATQIVWGYTKYATDAEAVAVGNDTVSLTPRSLDVVFNTRRATETLAGSTKLSTTAQATAGNDDTTAMTPLKVKQAVAALVPVQADATESKTGLVRLATVAQVRAGTIREGYAISPYTLVRLTATNDATGLIQLATQGEVNQGAVGNKAVTPATLINMKASGSQWGVTALSTTVRGDLPNWALSANAAVLASDRNSVTTGGVYQGSMDGWNKYQTMGEVDLSMPIGGVIMTAFNSDHGNLMLCNGRALNVSQYQSLFNRIGYTFGGGGGVFNIPDTRGVVVRGYDAGRGLDPGRGFGDYQGDMFGYHEHALQMIFQNGGNIPAWQAGYELVGANKNDQRVLDLDGTFSKAKGAGGNETRMKNISLNYVIRVA